MTATFNIATLLPWSEPRLVETRYGMKQVQDADPTSEFWDAWRDHKEELKAAGISVGKDYQDKDRWVATWWTDPPPDLKERLEANIKQSTSVDALYDIVIPCPEGLSYRPYQRGAIAFALGKEGVIYADEQGLGKTIEAIGRINIDPSIKKVIIVCPVSLKLNWHNELKRWLVRPMTIGLATPTAFPSYADIQIVGYSVVHRFTDLYQGYDLAILDEGTNIKNRKTKRNIGCRAIKARSRIVISGTPMENNPQEMFELLNWADPAGYKNYYKYVTKYCGARKVGRGFVFSPTDQDLANLQRKLRETCLTGDTMVSTAHGKIRIDDIHQHLPIKVWSRDQMGCVSLKPVVAVSRTEHSGLLVKVNTEAGCFTCTQDHQVFTASGYKRAASIKSGYFLLQMRQALPEKSIRLTPNQNRKALLLAELRRETADGRQARRLLEETRYSDQEVRALRATIRSKEQSAVQKHSVLFLQVQGDLGVSDILAAGIDVRGIEKEKHHVQDWPAKPEEGNKDRPNERRIKTENENSAARPMGAPWESCLKIAAFAGFGQAIPDQKERRGAHRLGIKTRDSSGHDGQTDGDRWTDDLLGHPNPGKKSDHRGGRLNTCAEISESIGQIKRPETKWVRVLSVEVLEMGCDGPSGGNGDGNQFVYDIQVADNENFFANGHLVHNCMVRRMKSEVANEIPPKTRAIIEMECHDQAVKQEMEGWKRYEPKMGAIAVAMELAKASGDDAEFTSLVEQLKGAQSAAFEEMAAVRKRVAEIKLPYVLDLIESQFVDNGLKVVTFGHHRFMIEAIAERFGDLQVTHYGGMSEKAKWANVQAFQTEPGVLIFNGSLIASGMGITLTAATNALCYEYDWRPGIMVQAEDRIHRIGQVNPVTIHLLVLQDSLDAYQVKTYVGKAVVIGKALDGPIAPAQVYEERPAFVPVGARPHVSPKREAIHKLAATIPPSHWPVIHKGLKILAAMDTDRARELNDRGFSKIDVGIGHALAQMNSLSPGQSALGKILLTKYRRQLPPDIVEFLGLVRKEPDGNP